MANNTVITIGREYGSGGREIALRLGELLGIPVYDNELLILAAKRKGLPEEYLRNADEQATGSLLYSLAMSVSYSHHVRVGGEMSINDKLFITQTEIIREIAQKESAIFVGRCADYVLREHPNHISIFIHADEKVRAARIGKIFDCSQKEAEAMIAKVDKKRANYYNFYSGGKWGKANQYSLSLDSGLLGIEGSAALLFEAVKRLSNRDLAE